MILLLGATGLLGRNVLNVLLEKGLPVRVLVRTALDVEGPEVRQGSLLERETLLRAAEGCSAIINCAGTTDMRLPHPADFFPVNRDLPALLAQVAGQCGIPVLIHVSTANTIVSGSREHPSDESAPFGPPYDRSPYALSKKAGEEALLSYAAEHPELRLVILNPGFMLGAYDTKPSSGQLMQAAWRKPLMAGTRGGKSFLHVRDAAGAIVAALEKGEGRYLLTGEFLSLKDFYALQADVCGYRQLFVSLPDFLVRGIGILGDVLRKAGIRNVFYSHNTNQLLVEEWYDCSRARKDLNYTQTPVRQAVMDYFAWREQKG